MVVAMVVAMVMPTCVCVCALRLRALPTSCSAPQQKQTDRQTDGWTDRQTDRDRQMRDAVKKGAPTLACALRDTEALLLGAEPSGALGRRAPLNMRIPLPLASFFEQARIS